METVALSALRKLPFNQDSCIFLTAGTFKKALRAVTFFPTGNLILAEVLYSVLKYLKCPPVPLLSVGDHKKHFLYG